MAARWARPTLTNLAWRSTRRGIDMRRKYLPNLRNQLSAQHSSALSVSCVGRCLEFKVIGTAVGTDRPAKAAGTPALPEPFEPFEPLETPQGPHKNWYRKHATVLTVLTVLTIL